MTPVVVQEMTALYRTPNGTMTLLPHQAWALLEAEDCPGLFGDLPVGEGKTLLGFLLAHTGPYQRPWLVQPATLIEKTEREFRELSLDWRAHPRLQIVSAELLGSHTTGPKWFETHMPDCLIFDEAHLFKNRDSARCSRVAAYHDAHHPTIFTMSGTYHEDSLRDYHHLQKWSLPPELRFLPNDDVELGDWADAVDTAPQQRLPPGALRRLTDKPNPGLTDIRNALGDRMRSTPGVISVASKGPGCSIILKADTFNEYGPAVDAAFTCLEGNETTDGWPVKEAIVKHMHQWQYCLGYESYWDPRPPEEWRDALREWSKQCRDVLALKIDKVDSLRQVANAIDRGMFDPGPLTDWREIKPTFTPNVKSRVIDDAMVRHCAEWLATGTGKALWTRHVPFARRLSEISGVPYFGRKGLDAKGRSIESYTGPAILSIAANKNGRNLQDRYHTFYVVDPPGTFKDWEQLIGRAHRRGQKADVVTVVVLIACLSHYTALARARQRARNVFENKGRLDPGLGKPKIMLADWVIPSAAHFAGLAGPRWRTTLLDDDSVFDDWDTESEIQYD